LEFAVLDKTGANALRLISFLMRLRSSRFACGKGAVRHGFVAERAAITDNPARQLNSPNQGLRPMFCTCPRISSLVIACSLIWFVPHLVAQDNQAIDGGEQFTPMFSADSLQGWVRTNTPEETWSFQDGMLVCSGKPIGEIRTEKMYQNFVMELEWRHMVPGGNAGIFVWADDITSRGVPFHRGIEVQVLENAYGNNQSHTTHGDIFPIHGATMTPINGRGGSRAFPTENRSNPSPEWNHYRIECIDGSISLAVNGKVVTRGQDCVPRKGYLCLESEGGVVHYRNVRIRELPSTDVAPEQIAIADRGYRSIYSGLGLDGWEASSIGKWSVDDWVLSYVGPTDLAGQLVSTESVENIGFVVDVRLKDEASSAVLAAGPAFSIDLRAEPVRSALEADGKWNRIEAWTGVDGVELRVNGADISLPLPSVDEQRTTMASLRLSPTGKVDFCNLYVRSFNGRQ
jgi:hypothetical protein